MLRREGQGLFGEIKQCAYCGKRLPISYTDEYCPNCTETLLLQEVKDYIRTHDVKDYELADIFGIPLRVVKGWIKEGHIEYKESPNADHEIHSVFCENCGCSINFGTLCPKCLKEANRAKIHGFAVRRTDDSSAKRMHHLGGDKK